MSFVARMTKVLLTVAILSASLNAVDSLYRDSEIARTVGVQATAAAKSPLLQTILRNSRLQREGKELRILRGGSGLLLRRENHDENSRSSLFRKIGSLLNPIYVCFVGFTAGCGIILTCFFIVAELLERISKSPDRTWSSSSMALFAIIGSVFGAAGGGACVGKLADSHAGWHAAILGSIFTALQVKQLKSSPETPVWFTIGSIVPLLPICVAAARLSASTNQILEPSALRSSFLEDTILPTHTLISASSEIQSHEFHSSNLLGAELKEAGQLPGPAIEPPKAVASGASFVVHFPRRAGAGVEQGETVAVCGNHASLGQWLVEAAFNLQPAAAKGDDEAAAGRTCWSGTLALPAGTEAEYKYVVLSPARSRWENVAANRRLVVPADGGFVQVCDTWETLPAP